MVLAPTSAETNKGLSNLALLNAFVALEDIHLGLEEAARELEAARAAPVCVPDCGRCCEENIVWVWMLEAEYILGCVVGEGRFSKLMKRCEDWLLSEHSGVTLRRDGPLPARITDPQLVAQLNTESAALARTCCPLLTPEKTCSIHAFRPLSCRTYGITRVVGPDCKRPLGLHESQDRQAFVGGQLASSLQTRLQTLISGLPAEYRMSRLLPTALFAAGRPEIFKAHVESGRITLAKLRTSPASPSLLWQEQIDRLTAMTERSSLIAHPASRLARA